MSDTGTRFIGYTLVDVTDTGVYRSDLNQLRRNQQRNWETVLQVLGLRTQPMDIVSAQTSTQVDLSLYKFGKSFTGLQNCWQFVFCVEQQDIFGDINNPTNLFAHDFNSIPIIINLTESAKLDLPLFQTNGEFKNIYFEVYSNLD
ncbi:hypothetical protein UFOVP1636_309 [uncultured Caudovirales phage]|uniref:Uncharacterized protein n=1 Tax=uncultured Caudovirales phage TaxID=2100421 RepID=A0A6J5T2J5_9CAUD|nr:hypothetical protein UFOVP1636_309 [uncultured Caudovirales phage]